MIPLRTSLHETDRPSLTAQATALGRALELDREPDQRIVSDRYAPFFLNRLARRGLALASGPVGGLVRMGERTDAGAISTAALCRHRFVDGHLLEALPDVDQVLILGAGWDSRAYRFATSIGRRPVLEVDLAPLSRAKRRIVDANPETFRRGRAVSVEIDFRTQSLPDRLDGSGFRVGAPTFVIWEGVSMYLSRDAVAGTLRTLAGLCGPGSTLTMDFWQHVRGFGPFDHLRRLGEFSLGLIGEPLTLAVPAPRVGPLLEDSGWETVEISTSDTMTSRYATAGRRCDECMYSIAARLL